MRIKILAQKPNYFLYYVRYTTYPTKDAIKFYGVFFCKDRILHQQKQIFVGKEIENFVKVFEVWGE